jgi:hypothetical protein
MAALLAGGSTLPVGRAVQALEDVVAAEVGAQPFPVLGDEVYQDLVHVTVVEDIELDTGHLPRVTDGFLDAVNEREVPEHEHADPRQLPTLFEFGAVGAQIVLDLLA